MERIQRKREELPTVPARRCACGHPEEARNRSWPRNGRVSSDGSHRTSQEGSDQGDAAPRCPETRASATCCATSRQAPDQPKPLSLMSEAGSAARGVRLLEPGARQRFDGSSRSSESRSLTIRRRCCPRRSRESRPRISPRTGDGPRPQPAPPGAVAARDPPTLPSSSPSTAGSFPAPRTSTTSSPSSPSGWPRCSRSSDR